MADQGPVPKGSAGGPFSPEARGEASLRTTRPDSLPPCVTGSLPEQYLPNRACPTGHFPGTAVVRSKVLIKNNMKNNNILPGPIQRDGLPPPGKHGVEKSFLFT